MSPQPSDDGAPDRFVSIAGSEQHPQYFTAQQWHDSPQAGAAELAWFTDARYGMFVHFGLSSLLGVELGWGRGTRIAPDEGVGPVADEEYDQLYTRFTIESFDADELVRVAQTAGMRYLVVVTKHHDGFHLWPTATSDYSIAASPFGRDYIGEMVAACQAAGLPIGLYFSQRDWYHPDYDPDGHFPDRDHRRYVSYLRDAVTELLTRYGRIDVLWFDAAWWGGMFDAEDWDAEGLNRLARELQPHILINNRASIPGDFDTPEQVVGAASRRRPWESCITVGSAWAWKPDDTVKSADQIIDLLTRTVGGDGNLLLNVGPRPDGTIEPRQVDLLTEVGDWLGRHSDLVHGTRGGPWLPGTWGASTCRGSVVHLFVGSGHSGSIALPALEAEVIEVRHHATGEPSGWHASGSRWEFALPHRSAVGPAVLTITLDREAFALTTLTVSGP